MSVKRFPLTQVTFGEGLLCEERLGEILFGRGTSAFLSVIKCINKHGFLKTEVIPRWRLLHVLPSAALCSLHTDGDTINLGWLLLRLFFPWEYTSSLFSVQTILASFKLMFSCLHRLLVHIPGFALLPEAPSWDLTSAHQCTRPGSMLGNGPADSWTWHELNCREEQNHLTECLYLHQASSDGWQRAFQHVKGGWELCSLRIPRSAQQKAQREGTHARPLCPGTPGWRSKPQRSSQPRVRYLTPLL